MTSKNIFQKVILALGRVMPGVICLLMTRQANANPTGMTVQSGSASFTVNGSRLTVTVGNNSVLSWQKFNIGAGETTVFQQPTAGSVVWNRITDQNPSQIYGSLQANGIVVLLNSSGFYFGPNSYVSTAGLVVSTANFTPPQNAGGAWQFNGPPPLASIVNYGALKVGQGGSCFLIADQVENHGKIEAPGGTIGLAAGQTVQLSERPDGRGLSMDVTLPKGSVDNYGTLLADAGTISLNAKVVNQNGFIQANSVQNHNGVIELVAGDQLNLGADSRIQANGDSSAGGSAGGSIVLKSDNGFSDVSGSEMSVTGGANGGNGGSVEISAPKMAGVNSVIDGTAQAGAKGGKLLLDPDYITLNNSGTGDDPDTTYLNVNSGFLGMSQITLQAAYDIVLADGTSWNLSGSTMQSSGSLVLEAGRNIIFGNADDFGNGVSIVDGNSWSIEMYAGVTDFANKVVSPGAGSIYLNAFDPNNLNQAADHPNGFIQSGSGDITLVAGQDIIVGTGYVNTTAGGNITAHALLGNIDTGGYAQGYVFQAADSVGGGYYVDPVFGVGGISTRAGGNVNLTAGGDVMSVLPVKSGYYYDGISYTGNEGIFPNLVSDYIVTAGSGAYGPEQGNVTIVAGGNVSGNYVLANGTGRIYAGVLMDAQGNPKTDALGNYVLGNTGSAGYRPDLGTPTFDLSLNLVSGGWNVNAAQNIVLDEVSNPNGEFNRSDSTTASYHAFDYSDTAYVNLAAGNKVQLGETVSVLPRTDNLHEPVIYPGILNIDAGAGGVEFDGDSTYKQLILYPSPEGGLTINTTGGGSIVGDVFAADGVTPIIFSLVASDSGKSRYLTSGDFDLNDHKATPVHYGSETPFVVNDSGNMSYLLLGAPEAAQINVVGDMKDCRFQGMNLSSSDTTSITVGQAAKANLENSGILNAATDGGLYVGGNITDRSAFTSILIPPGEAPDLALLANAINNTVDGTALSAATLLSSFYYTPPAAGQAMGTLTYQSIPNVKVADILALLNNVTVQEVDKSGNVVTDSAGNPVTRKISLFSTAQAGSDVISAMVSEYNSLGQIPSGAGGFTIGGGGTFAFTAANIDLGTSTGIQSKGVGLYSVGGQYPLAKYFTRGADISIDLTGDLTMYSSVIASLNGGNISIGSHQNPVGSVAVGAPNFSVTTLGARGIYTTDAGNISVIANGNVDVNGSRIAAYDGGNVTVESLNGDVNAGTGGSGFVVVNSYKVDPLTHRVTPETPTIPGSGILATTFPDDAGQVVGNILVEAPNGNVNASAGGIVQLPLNGVNEASSIVDVLAGYELRDAQNNPLDAGDIASGTAVLVSPGRNIDASGSGVIGSTVQLEASGNITGAIFARNNLNINAQQNVNVTALSEGSINVNSGGSISGTLIGVGGIAASGASDSANLESNNGITGNTSGSKGLGQGTAANGAAEAASASQANSATSGAKTVGSDDEDLLKKKKPITLARKVSRVTVILPGKN